MPRKEPKNAIVVLAGSGKKYEVGVLPGVTAQDLLQQLGLKGHLRKFEEAKPFGANEELYNRIEDGEKLVSGPHMPVAW